MKLKFINNAEDLLPHYVIEEDFKDTSTAFHERLGFIFQDELGIHWNINEDYSGIIELGELLQITDFMKSLEDKRE